MSVPNVLANGVGNLPDADELMENFDYITDKLRQPNILDNGGFNIWQRGTSFTNPADAAFTADRWKVATNSATSVVFSRESSVVDVGGYSAKAVVSGSPSSKYWYIRQAIENYESYKGKTITLSVRMKSSVASACSIFLYDSVSAPTSAYHTGGGDWETLSVSLTVSSSATLLWACIGFVNNADLKNGTHYFDSAMLTVSDDAEEFVPTNPAIDMLRCQRYFQVLTAAGTNFHGMAQCFSTTTGEIVIKFKATMRTVPTITIGNQTHFGVYTAAGAGNLLSTLTASDGTPDSYRFSFVAGTASLVAGNAAMFFTSNADAYIYASADI